MKKEKNSVTLYTVTPSVDRNQTVTVTYGMLEAIDQNTKKLASALETNNKYTNLLGKMFCLYSLLNVAYMLSDMALDNITKKQIERLQAEIAELKGYSECCEMDENDISED